jgi:hypothetical protein
VIKNKLIFGLLASILVSLFGFLILYVLKFMPNNISLNGYISMLQQERLLQSSFLSLSLLANIPLLYFLQKRKRFEAFKGVGVFIVISAVYIIALKFNLI